MDGVSKKAARVHHAARQRGSGVAAAARAQQGERMRRIGVLMSMAADDPDGQPRITAFAQGMREVGWAVGRNVRIDTRWAAGDPDRIRKYAAELVALAPDVILANGTPPVVALQQATPTVPIVFVQSPILSVQAWSRAWRGLAATSPALLGSNTAQREMAGTAQRDRTARDASGGRSRARHSRQPASWAQSSPWRLLWGGVVPHRRARRARDRARGHGIRTRLEWRPDRDGGA